MGKRCGLAESRVKAVVRVAYWVVAVYERSDWLLEIKAFWRGLGSEGEQPVAIRCAAYEFLAGKMNGTEGHW